MSRRISNEEINKRYGRIGLKVLDIENYVNQKTRLTAVDKDGYKVCISTPRKNGNNSYRKFHKKNPYTIENIRLWVSLNDPDYELVSTEYYGKSKKLEWRMLSRPDLPTFFTSWHMFYSDGSRHPDLGQQRASDGRRRKPEEVRRTVDRILKEKYEGWSMDEGEEFKYTRAKHTFLNFSHVDGYKSTSLYNNLFAYNSLWLFHIRMRDESTHNMYLWMRQNVGKYVLKENQNYTSMEDKYEFICKKHGSFLSSFQTFRQGQNGCKKCVIEANTGEGNGNWNPDIPDEKRVFRHSRYKYTEGYHRWVRLSLERDKRTCQICGSKKKPVVHHKDGFHWCVERRTDLTNSVTLCSICHDDFHAHYGNHYNTEEQFNEYATDMKEIINKALMVDKQYSNNYIATELSVERE